MNGRWCPTRHLTYSTVLYQSEGLRFQNPAPNLNVEYHSTVYALATIMREERLGGIFKGILVRSASAAAMSLLPYPVPPFSPASVKIRAERRGLPWPRPTTAERPPHRC
jgi:hypothetical protein